MDSNFQKDQPALAAENGHRFARWYAWVSRIACLVLGFLLIYAPFADHIFIIGRDPRWGEVYWAIGIALAVVVCLPLLLPHLTCKGLFITALFLRILWVVSSGVEQTSDFATYDRMAANIMQGDYLLNPKKPTGAPIFLALQYRLFGHHQLIPQLTQALLSALQVLLIYQIAARTTGREIIGKLAGLFLAIWPEHLLYTNLLGSDVISSTAVLTAIWLMSPFIERNTPRIFAAGLLLSVCHWMRPTAPLFVVAGMVFLVGAYFTRAGWRPTLKICTAFAGGFMLLVLPIMYENHRILGAASPSPSQMSGWSLLVGSSIEGKGGYNREDGVLLKEELERQTPREGEHKVLFQDRVAREMAIARTRSNPGEFLKMAVTCKIAKLWSRPGSLGWSMKSSRYADSIRPVYRVSLIWHQMLLLLAAIGFFAGIRGKAIQSEQMIFVWAALFSTAAHFLLESQPRYHHVFLPLLAISAGQAVVFGTDAVKSIFSRTKRIQTPEQPGMQAMTNKQAA